MCLNTSVAQTGKGLGIGGAAAPDCGPDAVLPRRSWRWFHA
jgi:hypothetical protein